jgi:hypothetical protein
VATGRDGDGRARIHVGGQVDGVGPIAAGSAIDGVVAGSEVEQRNLGRRDLRGGELVERRRRNKPLNEGDRSTYYGGGAKGYTDYPAL